MCVFFSDIDTLIYIYVWGESVSCLLLYIVVVVESQGSRRHSTGDNSFPYSDREGRQ